MDIACTMQLRKRGSQIVFRFCSNNYGDQYWAQWTECLTAMRDAITLNCGSQTATCRRWIRHLQWNNSSSDKCSKEGAVYPRSSSNRFNVGSTESWAGVNRPSLLHLSRLQWFQWSLSADDYERCALRWSLSAACFCTLLCSARVGCYETS